MRVRSLCAAFVLGASMLLAATAASAATVDQIVALSKVGVAEPVILAVIERDRSIMTIEPDQIVALKREGVSDTVIMAMLRSGREEADRAAQAVAEANAEALLASMSSAPDVLIVGHGPNVPNAGDAYQPGAYGVAYVPYYAPGAYGRGAGRRRQRPQQQPGIALPPVVPPTALPAQPVPSATGIFFEDGGGAARGIFFPPAPRR